MTVLFQRHILPAILALIVFLTALPFVESVVRYSNDEGPAIVWKSVKVLTPIVRPGEKLVFEYTRQHMHQCPADLRRFIMLPNEDIVMRYPLVPGGGRTAEDGVKTVQSSVVIPLTPDDGKDAWRSGPYIYRMTAVRFCKNRIEYDTAIPDVHFTLEVPQ